MRSIHNKRFLFWGAMALLTIVAIVHVDAIIGTARVKYAATGVHSTCVVLDYSQVKCFGATSSSGVLGNEDSKDNIGDETDETKNAPPLNLNMSVSTVSVGKTFACALSVEGRVKCWGDGYFIGLEGQQSPNGFANWGGRSGEIAALPYLNFGDGLTVKAISSGEQHSCVILSDNGVKCWGWSGDGRLSNARSGYVGSGPDSMGNNLPYLDFGFGRWAKQISAGYDHTCAILNDNSLNCWGKNSYGQLGRGDTATFGDSATEKGENFKAVELGENRYATQVSAGNGYTCAILDDHSLKCWGNNNNGQLGLGLADSNYGRSEATLGDALPTINLGTAERTAKHVSAGDGVTCVVLDDNSAKCWGVGSYGQLMQGNRTTLGKSPSHMSALEPLYLGSRTHQVLSVDVGSNFVCALHSPSLQVPGLLTCWGDGEDGRLGWNREFDFLERYGDGEGEIGGDDMPPNIDFGDSPTGTPTSSPVGRYTPSVSPSTSAPSTAPSTSRPSYAPSTAPSKTPSTSRPTASPYVQAKVRAVSAGKSSTCALMEYGQIKCFGAAKFGRLGQGQSKNDLGDDASEMGANLPIVDLDFAQATAISVGSSHACAVSSLGHVKCWGFNQDGALGQESKTTAIGDDPNEMGSNLTSIKLGTGRTVKAISAGDRSTCVILDTDDIKCWGSSFYGRLGHNSSSTEPIGDDDGEMGDALPITDLGIGKKAKAISVGGDHACAILNDDSLKCWGDNSHGQLGLGHDSDIGDDMNEMGDNLPPVQLGTDLYAVQVSAGGSHTCVVLNTGAVKCFGNNDDGQLGIGVSSADKGTLSSDMGDNLPTVNLGAGRTALKVAAGCQTTCVLLDDHSVKCWGSNDSGAAMARTKPYIGTNSSDMADLAVINLGSRTYQVIDISMGVGMSSHHVCVLFSSFSSSQGYITCWGYNGNGQLGVGDKINYGDKSDHTGGDLKPATVDLGPVIYVAPPTSIPSPTQSPSMLRQPIDDPSPTDPNARRSTIVGASVAAGVLGLLVASVLAFKMAKSKNKPQMFRLMQAKGAADDNSIMLVPINN